tara:strand:+ start:920 stop:1684 length:765 start_codon:yes stop_codon:yes gene_type:complete
MLEISIISALSDNYVYLLRNEQKNLTSVIDPGEAEPVIKFLKNKNWHLDEIINTHHHNDHIGGNDKLLNVYKSKLIAPSYDKKRISNVDIFVSDNETLNIAGVFSKVIHTPGHTLGHVCFYMPEEKCLFSGDTLFYLGCGRVFEGTMNQMWSSLVKLRSLPDDTTIFCGHEYTLSNMKFANYIDPYNTLLNKVSLDIKNKREKGLPTVPFNLGMEKKINPFFRADDHNFIETVGLNSSNASESFGEIRLKKDSF